MIPLYMLFPVSLWLVAIIVSAVVYPMAFWPIIGGCVAYFTVTMLAVIMTDTDSCLHHSPLFSDTELENMMTKNENSEKPSLHPSQYSRFYSESNSLQQREDVSLITQGNTFLSQNITRALAL